MEILVILMAICCVLMIVIGIPIIIGFYSVIGYIFIYIMHFFFCIGYGIISAIIKLIFSPFKAIIKLIFSPFKAIINFFKKGAFTNE